MKQSKTFYCAAILSVLIHGFIAYSILVKNELFSFLMGSSISTINIASDKSIQEKKNEEKKTISFSITKIQQREKREEPKQEITVQKIEKSIPEAKKATPVTEKIKKLKKVVLKKAIQKREVEPVKVEREEEVVDFSTIPDAIFVSSYPSTVSPSEAISPESVNSAPSHSMDSPSRLPSMAQASPQAKQNYFGEVVRLIAKEKRYPEMAKRSRTEGVTTLQITLSKDGELLNASLTSKSDSAHLNREAIRMAYSAAPFPKPPTELLNQAPLNLTVPIRFELH